jgi:hypothetical protein
MHLLLWMVGWLDLLNHIQISDVGWLVPVDLIVWFVFTSQWGKFPVYCVFSKRNNDENGAWYSFEGGSVLVSCNHTLEPIWLLNTALASSCCVFNVRYQMVTRCEIRLDSCRFQASFLLERLEVGTENNFHNFVAKPFRRKLSPPPLCCVRKMDGLAAFQILRS